MFGLLHGLGFASALREIGLIVSPTDLEVRFRPNGIEVLALELQPEPDREAVEEAVA